MESQRVQVKVYAVEALPLERFIPVFHRWIKDKVLDELAIDVADYGHVTEGPGVLLVGHAFDYCWDLGEGRAGLAYTRKREAPPPAERLADTVRRALLGARLLEQEAELSGLHFRGDEILVRALDRMRAPANAEGFAALKGELEALGRRLYGQTSVTVERVGDDLEPLGARLKASAPVPLADLLARFG